MFNMVAIARTWDSSILEKDEPELRVVAFYEDVTAGEWAKEIFDRIRNRVPRDTKTTPGLWRFDILHNEQMEALAVADVACAAVIIVAARGTRALPKRLLECLEEALSQKETSRVGLVAVLGDTNERSKDSLPAYRQLQEVSRKARVRFFSLPCRNLAEPAAGTDTFRLGATRVLDFSLSIETRSFRAWGLNE